MKNVNVTVTLNDLASFLTVEYGNDLAVWADGSISIVSSTDSWTAGESPVARVPCPGIGNIDSSYFKEGFVNWSDDEGAFIVTEGNDDAGRVVGQLEDVIRECCQEGDVESYYDDLMSKINEAMKG